MCPLWPAHYFLVYFIFFGPLWILSFQVLGAATSAVSNSFVSWNVVLEPSKIENLTIGETKTVTVKLKRPKPGVESINNTSSIGLIELHYETGNADVATIFPKQIESAAFTDKDDTSNQFDVNVTGHFLGRAVICAHELAVSGDQDNDTVSSAKLNCTRVSVIRKRGWLHKAFTYSVICLVTIIYVNMGAALDTQLIKETLRRPVGPFIGFCTQFITMPLLSYGIAKCLIPRPDLQLGLFLTGCSPGGGASNIWTLTLGGNLDLSITMTTISTFSAFVMMPLWILTLGRTIFSDANLAVPYSRIGSFAAALVVPLTIGLLIQRFLPRVAKFLVKILKPFAVFLIVFIVVFAIYTNLYIFQLFTWQIVLAGLFLPLLGYIFGGSVAALLKQEWKDVIAIGVETGVQNTGLAIFALQISFNQPEADIATVLPVAVAMMTPIVPSIVLLTQKIRERRYKGATSLSQKEDSLTPSV